ncbi:translation initiation factor IF-2 [Flexilinea flocculi]|jgi:translation initiation factor IF-2|uniref:Translation initiation factor IF-2 n=1 Tax=Flexilinea flocculi TaxID=1678840 RepID=A0A0S7BYP9_9CHLR|nr:translation initiation factor IF-2 [Flexilinea flocculi]GAP41736.1 translation initiation factor IF-2 [Flexilinea flocculi]
MGENVKKIEIPYAITVRDLAKLLQSNSIQVIKVLMANGVMANINQMIDYDTAAIVANEIGFEAVPESENEVEIEKDLGEVPLWRQIIEREDQKNLIPRPPVVTILGHVDHGKTSLLDAIRHTNVTAGEAGGITQHIGAYQIESHGKAITFLDTPGHAAFSAMRARGAQGADIVILVVAANDGVMPQTKEAISHAKAARVPIIVALNKIDRSDANQDLVKKQLSEQGLMADTWGGNTMVVPVSAKQKIGIEDLMEAILMTAEEMKIMANPKGKVFGTVVEASVDTKKGVMATLLVQNGTLKMGDVVLAGNSYGKIRAMFDFRGKKIQKAGPSTPVQIMGLTDVPTAGDIFQVYFSEKEARAVVSAAKADAALNRNLPKATLEELFAKFKAGETKELCLIIKTDVNGSLEPIINSLNELSKEGEIKVNILHAEAGNISENDVMLAAASHGVVIGFNVQADPVARKKAENEGVSIRIYDIIYRLTEDIEKALKGMLEPEYKEVTTGKAEVLAVFKISKLGSIAGSRVREGELRKNSKIRVVRKGEIIYTGEISSLKHEKDDVKEVKNGLECGVSIKGFDAFEVGDILEAFTLERSGS